MKWQKGTEKTPTNSLYINCKLNDSPSVMYYSKHHDMFINESGDFFPIDQVEWLDEESPSFSIEDMEDSFFEGKSGELSFNNFMKQEHNIDITK